MRILTFILQTTFDSCGKLTQAIDSIDTLSRQVVALCLRHLLGSRAFILSNVLHSDKQLPAAVAVALASTTQLRLSLQNDRQRRRRRWRCVASHFRRFAEIKQGNRCVAAVNRRERWHPYTYINIYIYTYIYLFIFCYLQGTPLA